MDQKWRPRAGEVLDPGLLRGLGVLSRATGRSVVEELNNAVSSYLLQELPPKIGEDGLALLVTEMRDTTQQIAISEG